jgi:hypothetical protein
LVLQERCRIASHYFLNKKLLKLRPMVASKDEIVPVKILSKKEEKIIDSRPNLSSHKLLWKLCPSYVLHFIE